MSEHQALRVSYEPGAVEPWLSGAGDVLAVFEFGRSPLDSLDPRHVPVALPQLDAPRQVEVWRCDGPVKRGTWDLLRFAQGEQLTMGHIALDLREGAGMREVSRQAYDILQSYLLQTVLARHHPDAETTQSSGKRWTPKQPPRSHVSTCRAISAERTC